MDLAQAISELGYQDHLKSHILDAYNEPHRFYHNQDHINYLLGLADLSLFSSLEDRRILLETIVWHDIVYPAAPSTPGLFELQSILAYHDSVEMPDQKVEAAILASAFHNIDQPSANQLTKHFLDLDLSSFARYWDDCWNDSQNVKKELEAVYGERRFLVGNLAFLKALLNRETIYYTTRKGWEAKARDNIWHIMEKRREELKHCN